LSNATDETKTDLHTNAFLTQILKSHNMQRFKHVLSHLAKNDKLTSSMIEQKIEVDTFHLISCISKDLDHIYQLELSSNDQNKFKVLRYGHGIPQFYKNALVPVMNFWIPSASATAEVDLDSPDMVRAHISMDNGPMCSFIPKSVYQYIVPDMSETNSLTASLLSSSVQMLDANVDAPISFVLCLETPILLSIYAATNLYTLENINHFPDPAMLPPYEEILVFYSYVEKKVFERRISPKIT
jgi:hypothetical protein